jgi:hypothetical protein
MGDTSDQLPGDQIKGILALLANSKRKYICLDEYLGIEKKERSALKVDFEVYGVEDGLYCAAM